MRDYGYTSMGPFHLELVTPEYTRVSAFIFIATVCVTYAVMNQEMRAEQDSTIEGRL